MMTEKLKAHLEQFGSYKDCPIFETHEEALAWARETFGDLTFDWGGESDHHLWFDNEESGFMEGPVCKVEGYQSWEQWVADGNAITVALHNDYPITAEEAVALSKKD